MATMTLEPELEKRLEERVPGGEFPSVEAGVNRAVRELLEGGGRTRLLNVLIEESKRDFERGDFMDGEAFFEQMRAESRRRREEAGR